MRTLRLLTWHVHGNYLWYLSQIRHQIFLPVKPDGRNGYGGRGRTFPFAGNVQDVPFDEVRRCDFDAIVFQARGHYLEDQFELLSPAQQRLPRIYIEHDPPQGHPTDTRHWVDDPNALLVHVTPFNALMWDNGDVPVRVVEHGVLPLNEQRWSGDIPQGLVVVNNIARRGRRLGLDVWR